MSRNGKPVFYVYDCRPTRRAAIVGELERHGEVRARADVPMGPERHSAMRELVAPWCALLHVNNDDCFGFAQSLDEFVGENWGDGRWLVLYSGGEKEKNMAGFERFERRGGIGMLGGVGDFSEELLRQALADLGVIALEKISARSKARTFDPLRQRVRVAGRSGEVSLFEKDRSHVSHDLFTNGFCSPLGFHCTDPESPRRGDLMLWARSDPGWWERVKTSASRWSDVKPEVDRILRRAEELVGESWSAEGLDRVAAEAYGAMETIDECVEKLSRSTMVDAALTDDEIGRFWRATDAVRVALRAVHVSEANQGPTPLSGGKA